MGTEHDKSETHARSEIPPQWTEDGSTDTVPCDPSRYRQAAIGQPSASYLTDHSHASCALHSSLSQPYAALFASAWEPLVHGNICPAFTKANNLSDF